jgi:hypothetical protein
MAKPLFSAKGKNGTLHLYEEKITIERDKGLTTLLLHGLKGDKDIQISEISSIQFKQPGLTVGYIQIGFKGSIEAGRGVQQAVKDENTVTFLRKGLPVFIEMKEKIESRIASIKNIGNRHSELDEIEKLFNLKEKGIISDDEFNQKKQQLLKL